MDTNWLKDAQEHFREAMGRKEWDMAKAVVEDVKGAGFTGESETMLKEWTTAPRETFIGEPSGNGLVFDGELRAFKDGKEVPLPSAPHGYILGFLRKKNEEYKAKGLVPTLDMLIEDLTN